MPLDEFLRGIFENLEEVRLSREIIDYVDGLTAAKERSENMKNLRAQLRQIRKSYKLLTDDPDTMELGMEMVGSMLPTKDAEKDLTPEQMAKIAQAFARFTVSLTAKPALDSIYKEVTDQFGEDVFQTFGIEFSITEPGVLLLQSTKGEKVELEFLHPNTSKAALDFISNVIATSKLVYSGSWN